MISQEYGIGLEAEGFMVNATGKPVSRIDGIPASAWVMKQLKKRHYQLVAKVGLELASVFLEIKTAVHQSKEAAVAEVLAVRTELNQILAPQGVHLVFMPVSSQEFEFVASSEASDSRAAQLVARWGQTAAGRENLIASSIASLQVNDSRPFRYAKTESERLEIARMLHNFCGYALPRKHTLLTTGAKDFRGKTRARNYRDMVTRVEADKFRRFGFLAQDAVIPPYFADVLAMQTWMCAYSQVNLFASTNPKDEHAMTCKIKRDPWMVEVRYPDAVDTEGAMLGSITVVEDILQTITHLYDSKRIDS